MKTALDRDDLEEMIDGPEVTYTFASLYGSLKETRGMASFTYIHGYRR